MSASKFNKSSQQSSAATALMAARARYTADRALDTGAMDIAFKKIVDTDKDATPMLNKGNNYTVVASNLPNLTDDEVRTFLAVFSKVLNDLVSVEDFVKQLAGDMAYQGLDLLHLFKKILNIEPDMRVLRIDAVYILILLLRQGPLFNEKVIKTLPADLQVIMTNLVTKYNLLDRVPTGDGRRDALTPSRFALLFPVFVSRILHLGICSPVVRVSGLPAAYSSPSVASIVPPMMYADYITWSVKFSFVINRKTKALAGMDKEQVWVDQKNYIDNARQGNNLFRKQAVEWATELEASLTQKNIPFDDYKKTDFTFAPEDIGGDAERDFTEIVAVPKRKAVSAKST